jgi:hypothetical protein
MAKYKVEYINTEKIESKWYQETKTHIDTWSLAKELEALLLEYESRGYKLFTIESIVAPVRMVDGVSSKTDGLMVVFEKEITV